MIARKKSDDIPGSHLTLGDATLTESGLEKDTHLRDRVDALESEVTALRASRSWRLTAPLRALHRTLQPDPATWSPSRLTVRLTVAGPSLALVVMMSILVAYGGLLPLGHWQGDEYFQGAFARDGGLSYLVGRLLGSSPRPVSETVLFAYYWLVAALQRPLIQPFLLAHWMMLALACFASMRWRPRESLVWRGLLGASLLCLFLVGHDVTELFFWPDAVAPYLETLAALLLLMFLTLDGRADTRLGGLAGIACLTLAAGSSEAGAMFVLPYTALRLAACLRRQPGRRLACAAGWGVPLVGAAIVLMAIAVSSRVAGTEPVPGAATLHRPLASLLASLQQFVGELIALDDRAPRAAGLVQGLAIKLLVFFALRWCWRLAAPNARRPVGLVAFAVAAVAATFGTIAAAEYQFGAICCSRHATLRQCWIILAIAGLAARSAPNLVGPWARLLTPILLVAAVGLAFLPRMPGLVGDYGLRAAAIEARSDTWRSGLAPGPAMTWYPPPDGRIVHSGDLPPGHFVLSDRPPWWALGLLQFFHKRTVDIEAAGARS